MEVPTYSLLLRRFTPTALRRFTPTLVSDLPFVHSVGQIEVALKNPVRAELLPSELTQDTPT